MSTSIRIWLTIGLGMASAAPLFAADARAQIYLGAEGGFTSLPDQTDSISGVTSATARFNNGFNAGVRVGYEWGRGASRRNTATGRIMPATYRWGL